MQANTTGTNNVATGIQAMQGNTTGSDNLATGFNALALNTTGNQNLATGTSAMFANTTGDENLAIGFHALEVNTAGNSNIALGTGAGQDLTTGSNNIDIGNAGKAGEQKVIRIIGTKPAQIRTFIAGISGKVVPGVAQPVVVNAQGQLGTASAAKASTAEPLSAADARQLMETVDRQQRALKRQQHEIDQLRKQVKGG